ncbi:LuxR C-terminal-related transcriptional regulator [Pandoraea pneumonica]|uniref:LuxR C-terminal-related transcriptional regulator n=1 Tax=Pandoraea pneumonica TaxID=2508299 RepID=UPI003CEC801D
MLPTLIPTKLAPAPKSNAWLERRRLTQMLTDDSHRAILICAPAGYGKTILMSQAFASIKARGERAGWVSVDRHDAAPVNFLTYLMAAVQRACPGFGERYFSLFHGRSGMDVDVYLDAALAELAGLEHPVVVFLDDIHYAASATLTEMLEALLRYSPDTVTFVLAARDVQHHPFWRLRAESRLTVIDAQALSFGVDEASEYFQVCAGRTVEPTQIETLLRMTEGWGMGLQLARIALEKARDPVDVIRHFSGRNQDISGYLLQNVLDAQRPEIQEFLLKTSILGRLCTRNCDALLSHMVSAEILDYLMRANLFLVGLDGEGQWYRYHPLFQEFLQKRLEAIYPEERVRLLRTASLWFREHQFAEEALALACATQDMPFIAKTLEATCNTLAYIGNHSAFQLAVRSVPQATISKFPRLALDQAWMEMMNWNFGRARHLLETVQQHLSTHPDVRGVLDELLLHRRLVLAFHCGEIADAASLSEQWLERYPYGGRFITGTANSVLMLARAYQMDNAGLTMASAKALDQYQGSGLRNAMVWHSCILGLTHECSGNVTEALHAYTQASELSKHLVGAPPGVMAMPAVLTAQVHYERNELDEARRLIDASPEMIQPGGLVEYAVAYFLTQSRLLAVSGDASQAAAALDRGLDFASAYALSHVTRAFQAEQVRQFLSAGRIDEARTIGKDMGLLSDAPKLPGDGATVREAAMAMTWGRITLCSGQGKAASTLMRRWMEYCLSRKCYRLAVQFAVLAAHGKWLSGDVGGALRLLAPALRLCKQLGMVRTMIDEGAPAHALLVKLYEAEGLLNVDEKVFARMMMRDMDARLNAAAIHLTPSVADSALAPLNNRELEILALMSQGITGRFVGLRLGITEGTVKWYMQRIFDKLGVRSRREAIEAARALGLFS